MNLLNNWTDQSLIYETGWSGNSTYDKENGQLLLTAINGWRSFIWTIPELVNKDIVFEFDYKFITKDNMGNSFVMSSNSYSGDIYSDITEHADWAHKIVSAKWPTQYIGINVRGTDGTGKTLSLAIKNILLYYKISNSNKLCKNGVCKTSELIENNKFRVYNNSIYCDDIIEN